MTMESSWSHPRPLPDGPPPAARPTDAIYLNNAAEGWPKAPGVAAAVARALEQPPSSAGRVAGVSAGPAAECRRRIANLLAVPDPNRIVLTTGATHALNLAVHGLGLRSGALVITTVTEHNSVLRPLFLLERQQRVRIVSIGLDAAGGLDGVAFEQALSGRPALVAINHASNVTGRINPVERLFAMAKDAGAVTLLDASQTAGHLPVEPLRLHADLVAFPGHKGFHGPAGTGALYVAPRLELDPLVVGGTGYHSQSHWHPQEMPGRLEAGTPNAPALAGLAAAFAWHAEHSDPFQRCASAAGRRLRDGLRTIPKVRLFDGQSHTEHLGVVSFHIRGWPVEEAGVALLESFGVVCRTGLHCAPWMHQAIGSAAEGTIRLSASGFNTGPDIDAALAAVAKLAA